MTLHRPAVLEENKDKRDKKRDIKIEMKLRENINKQVQKKGSSISSIEMFKGVQLKGYSRMNLSEEQGILDDMRHQASMNDMEEEEDEEEDYLATRM